MAANVLHAAHHGHGLAAIPLLPRNSRWLPSLHAPIQRRRPVNRCGQSLPHDLLTTSPDSRLHAAPTEQNRRIAPATLPAIRCIVKLGWRHRILPLDPCLRLQRTPANASVARLVRSQTCSQEHARKSSLEYSGTCFTVEEERTSPIKRQASREPATLEH